MIRHDRNISESWKLLPWKKFRVNLFRLQKRVFKAVSVGDMRKALSIQKLILKSRAARFMAIRQVTQLNAGKKTPGIDKKLALTHKERFELELILEKQASDWRHNQLRLIPIPKKDGSKRYLKVPTIADRCWQCLAKFALEPAHEATFHADSYGFRTGRSACDAQRQVFNRLNSQAKGISKRILELDIEKCFDRISHSIIMDNLIAPKGLKMGIFRCLKSGINPEFPDQGTCQGGVVSPLLANISLNGIEEIHPSVRYADDMVFLLKPGESEEKLLDKISQFLSARGLKVSEKKTKLTTSTDGFDFLGWYFKVQQNGKFRCIPSEENFKAFRQKIKCVVNNSNYGAKVKAKKLAPIVRGWRNYHKFCDMSGSRFSSNGFSTIEHSRCSIKRHSQDRHTAEELVKKAFPNVPYSENRHVKVRGNKSPYDGDLVYWSERNSKLYDGKTSKLLKKQNHTCGHCGHKLISDEKIHLHHLDGNHNNWKDSNLTVVHESCHDYIHMDNKRSDEYAPFPKVKLCN